MCCLIAFTWQRWSWLFATETMSHKAWNIYCLALHRKILPTLALNHIIPFLKITFLEHWKCIVHSVVHLPDSSTRMSAPREQGYLFVCSWLFLQRLEHTYHLIKNITAERPGMKTPHQEHEGQRGKMTKCVCHQVRSQPGWDTDESQRERGCWQGKKPLKVGLSYFLRWWGNWRWGERNPLVTRVTWRWKAICLP